MKKMRFRLAWLVVALLLATLFTGCGAEPEPDPNLAVLNIAAVVTAEDISQLDQYPNLTEADLRGSDCYDAILAYAKDHPAVTVTYDVVIGDVRYATDTKELVMENENLDYDSLMANLKYLPEVTAVSFPSTTLTMEQLTGIQEAYPNVTFSYTVEILGNVYSPDVTELDLTDLQNDDIENITQKLSYLPAVEKVTLTKEDGSNNLYPVEVKQLQDLTENIFFVYQFDLFGKTVSTSDEVIEYDEVPIGNEGEQQIREALDILTSCTYIKFDDCGIDSTVMAGIRDDYPDVKVVWRIHIEQYNMLTDETMLRLTFVLEDYNIHELKYCTDAVYVDIGHNSTLHDISFTAYMPNLECLILSGSSVSDLTPLANCKKLVWLEMCFCGYVQDLTPLKELESLKYLNVGYTIAKDFAPLDNLKLERFVCMGSQASTQEKNRFVELHPDCLSVLKGKQPYGYGWRYDDHGYTFFEYYRNMRKIFRYAEKDYRGNMKGK